MATNANGAGRTIALIGALALTCSACDPSVSVTGFSGATMGTSYDVVIEVGGPFEDSAPLGALIEGELARIDGVMSTYDPESDVSRFGRYAGSDPVAVDPSLVEVLLSALEVSRRSSGAFDPTVAPLVDAWGFGPEDVAAPAPARVTALMALIGYERLALDRAAGTLAKTHPGTRIDLSGVAKGFAAERIAAAVAELGYPNVLVDVGGEIKALGSHVDGRPWRVALEGPGERAPAVLGTVDLVDEAVATSGDFRNYYEDGGVLYSHIIDPRTGLPIPFRGFSVSVVHPDGAMADAWATALTVLGPDEGFELAAREELAALFAWRSPDGLRTRATPALEGRVTPVG